MFCSTILLIRTKIVISADIDQRNIDIFNTKQGFAAIASAAHFYERLNDYKVDA